MSLIRDLFGKSPFGMLVRHTEKVHECARQVRPLMEALVSEDYEEVHHVQDVVSKLEHEADVVKHEIRENLPRRYFLPVDRGDLERFLHTQDEIADYVEDFAVILMIRRTKIHPDLVKEFFGFGDQVLVVCEGLMGAAQELEALAEASFAGAEADSLLKLVDGLGQQEWTADRMQRKLSQHIYRLEKELDPVTILFYEKILHTLGAIANAAENTGELLRQMIIKR